MRRLLGRTLAVNPTAGLLFPRNSDFRRAAVSPLTRGGAHRRDWRLGMRIASSRQAAQDVEIQLALRPRGRLDVVDEADEIELERPVAEIGELDGRRGDLQHEVLRPGGLDQDFAHPLDVAVVVDIDRDENPPDPVGIDPVLDRVGDEARVRHDQGRPVQRLDLGGAGVDPAHESLVGADHHPVADPDAALPQQDQARDEVIGDRLQAEADSDRQRAGDEGELLDVEPDLGGAEQNRDRPADIAENRADRVADAGVKARLRQKALTEPALDEPRHEHGDGEHADRHQHRRQRQGDPADAETEIGGAQRAEPVLRLHAPGLEHRRRRRSR